MMTRIAFIGLGNMGGPMASNLLKAGHSVRVFDLSAEAVRRLVDVGASAGSSAVEAVADAEVVFTMLPAGPQVRSVYLGEGGLIVRVLPGTLLIECSTIDPKTAVEVAQLAAARGLDMLDAPVSGGITGARAGTLTFIVGGTVAVLERARPYLEAVGQKIFHAGASGAGQVAKIANNMLLAIHMIGTAEALNLGVAHGLDPAVLSRIIQSSSGRNWSVETYNPWPGVQESSAASRGYSGGFGSDLMLKDLGLSQEAAQEVGKATPLGTLAQQLYRLHCAAGRSSLDFSSIIQTLAEQARWRSD
jgi:3-hydroxyisobutyrate dehydrogenase